MDTVIVTLRCKGFEKDFELPCGIPLADLYPRLTEVLRKTSDMKFGSFPGVFLEKNGSGLLDKAATLLDYGIVTGSILDIVNEEKYNGYRNN